MYKAVVTTTISPPGQFIEAMKHYPDWHIYVAGDLKTPHDAYQKLDNVTYLSPYLQVGMNRKLSAMVGWGTPDRRCFAMIAALNDGADIVALMDDDNIPYPPSTSPEGIDFRWDAILPGHEVEVDIYHSEGRYFDPLSVTSENIWHRGYPISELHNRKSKYATTELVTPDVVAGLWDGIPDIDAVCKLAYGTPKIEYTGRPFTSNNTDFPFNSQNTFLSREVAKRYMSLISVGRVGDVWGAYMCYPERVIYTKPTVEHLRHVHDLALDAQLELYSYAHTFAEMPCSSRVALELYMESVR